MRTKSVIAGLAVLGLLGAGSATAQVPAASSAAPARTVHLITGDAVSVRQVGGRQSLTVAPLSSSGPAASSSRMNVGKDLYVVPAIARYYGGVLDPALFDVTRQLGASTVKVTVTHAVGAHPSVPGLTVTSSTATALHGYLTAAGTRAFGTALLAQWRSDLRAGHRFGTALFGASRIASTAPTTVHPGFPQVTLIIRATDAQGPVGVGTVTLINTDDGRKYNGSLFLQNGQARASVPLGNYSLIAEDDVFDPTASTLSIKLLTVPDFTVTTNKQQESLDFRSATTVPSISTPRPASESALNLEWARMVPQGGTSYGFLADSTVSFAVAPAAAPKHGTAEWETQWTLDGTAPGNPYRYDASYLDSGAIPANQHRVVTAAEQATVASRFHSDRKHGAAFGRSAFYPFDDFIFTALFPATAPLARTDYLVAPPAANWLDVYIGAPTDQDPFNGFVSDQPRYYPPGSTQRIDWLGGPLAPGIPQPTDRSSFYFCSACRSEDQLAVFFAPIVDSTPGHAGTFDAPDATTTVGTFSLYRNGTLLTSENNSAGDIVDVPSGPATYTAVAETWAGRSGFTRSTHAVTTLTFRSAAGAGGALPGTWACPVGGATCTVLPVLSASVPLPTDITDTMPLGSSTFTFTVAPSAGAPPVTVPSATLSISTDGGHTYRSVPVTALGGNRFSATITHPASDAGKLVTVRVAGADTAGDALAETVDDAYAVATH